MLSAPLLCLLVELVVDGLLTWGQSELADLRGEGALLEPALLFPQFRLCAQLRLEPAVLSQRFPLLLLGPGERVLLRIELEGQGVDLRAEVQLLTVRGVAAPVELALRLCLRLPLAGELEG